MFECDNCGACCESLIVEAYYYDALREPKLYQLGQKFEDKESCVILYDAETKACPFLNSESKMCDIYQTRPVACVMVEPGDAKCQQARRMKGKGLLRDKYGNKPTRETLEESCDNYGLEISEIIEDDRILWT